MSAVASRDTANSPTLFFGASTGGNIQSPSEAGNTTSGVPLGEGILLQDVSSPHKRMG